MAKKLESTVENQGMSNTEALKEQINKQYGKGTILSGRDKPDDLEVVQSGSLTLDVATGIGGLPVGKLIEIFGPESAGKSTLTLHAIAEFQKAGKEVALIDHEHSFDKKYARSLGVDIDKLLISQPGSMEDGYNIAEFLIKSKKVGLVVVDSQTSMVPKKCLEGEIGDAKIALQARINSEALNKIKPLLGPNSCTLIIISQLRTAIGNYGDPNVPSGGNALKFYSDMRFKVSKTVEKEDHNNKTKVEVIKNKCASPFGKCEFHIIWGEGVDRKREIIELASEFDLIKSGGAGWVTIGETKLQGIDKVKEFLTDNPEYSLELEKQVITKLKTL